MKGRFHVSFCAVALFLGLISPFHDTHQKLNASAQAGSSNLPLTPCKMPGVEEELRCGTLTVFENRESRSGRTINLNVVVLPALAPGVKDAPLFDLAGGPGIAATDAAGLYATILKDFRRRRDVVLVDQRGTGGSNPLHCRRDISPQRFLDEMYPVEYVKKCRQELERKADLALYTTPIAMDDLDDVRAWLGYEQINLLGLSYGTRAALVYMRRHPNRVRSAILMGVSPTYHKIPFYHARDGERAMNLLLDECAADKNCNRAFPRLRQELRQVLERLERRPLRVTYVMPESGENISIEIRHDIFSEKLRRRLYEPPNARRLPLVIHRAAKGDFDPFLKLVIPADLSRTDFVADGMYLSVTCAEDTSLIDPKVAARMNKKNMFGNYRVFQQSRACGLWPRAKLPDGYHRPVATDIPVLILSGHMDPITPPEWGNEAARHLPNSKHVVIRHHAHVPVGLSHLECLDQLIMEFLTRADVKGLNTSCVRQMLPPPFILEEPKKKAVNPGKKS